MIINDILVEFAPSGDGGGSGDYFQALASAWYNGVFDSGSLQKGIKSQQDVERLLQRGIIGPDGVTRKYAIDYNSTFDGVVISSDDYYEHSDYNDQGQEVDSRNGRPWGPNDYMEFGDEELDEGLKSALGAAAMAGSMALGSAGANARVMPGDDPAINRLTGKPNIEQPAPADIKPTVQTPTGFSKEYLQKASDPDRTGRYMISIEKAQELLKNMQEDLDEGKKKSEPPEADYGAEYQDMVSRVKKLAGLGPLKTQYDPQKRVYKNVPTAVQPKK